MQGLITTLALTLAVGLCPASSGPGRKVRFAAARVESTSPPRASKLRLRVRVSNLDNNRGRVAVALFKGPRGFPEQGRAKRGQVTRIEGANASVVFRGLDPGIYAIAVLHDENENSKMDFNFLGIPLEGFGFSNDAAATFGPPEFAEAAFRLRHEASVVSVSMRYLL